MLVRRAKDVRMLMVYGYARLVAYDRDLEIKPDILKDIEVEDGRIFTLHLRKGHKWSDGHPFTSEDFRYYWEDVANNKHLYPAGPPRALLVGGVPPKVEFLDETTVRYTWPAPNPNFLPALAGPLPLTIYRPAHYLKQFHADYADPDRLQELIKKYHQRNWAALHNRMDSHAKFHNPDMPTLQPWRNITSPPSTRFIGERNPYYYRLDSAGRQLPYIDRVEINVVDAKLIPAKAGTGEADLQARGLSFNDYTFLKAGEKRNNYTVRLWRMARGSHLALYPNLNINDPVWRKLFRDVRFRRALSLGIDRHEINQVLYYGLAIEGNNSVLPQSPLYDPSYRKDWAEFDIKRANRLLDEIGLTEYTRDGIRKLPDGRPAAIIVETAGESTEQTDVLELIHDSWLKLGIKLYSRPSQREVFRNRIFAGQTQMAIWFGLENGIPNASSDPWELAPTTQQTLEWPKWGQYYETQGRSGTPPDIPAAQRLIALYEDWRGATSDAERRAIWKEMLEIHRDQVFTIGLIAGVFQPVVVANNLVNVPDEGIYNWDPGAHFGIYKPDTFWFDDRSVAQQ